MSTASRRRWWPSSMSDARTRERSGGSGKSAKAKGEPDFSWREIAYQVQVSRELDRLEEEELVPQRKVLYQFSARGHDMAQVMLGATLTHRHDAACGYYRSRPLLLALDNSRRRRRGGG